MTAETTIHPWVSQAAQNLKLLPHGVTRTTYTTTITCSNEQKRLHALAKLATWATELTEKSGIVVEKFSLRTARPHTVYPYGNYLPAAKNQDPWVKPRIGDEKEFQLELEIHLAFNGSVDLTGFITEIQQSISGGIEKNLALRTIVEFFLPFRETLSALGQYTVDALVLTNVYHGKVERGMENSDFAGGIETMLPLIRDHLATEPIHIGMLVQDSWGCAIIQIIWTEEVTDNWRSGILSSLKSMFETKMAPRWPIPPTDAHFMVW